MEHLDKDCECGSKSSPTRDVRNHTGYINAKEVTIASFGAMKSFTPSMVTSNSSLLEPKIEVNLFSEADPNLGSFQQLETQLLDDMEISEQQSSHCPKTEVFGDDYMHEPGTSVPTPSHGSKNSACLDDTPSIGGGASAAKNVPDAFTEKHVDKRPKHADTLCKCSKENGKIPLIFPKKDGHPVGKYASEFMTELGKAVKKFAPLQVSGWKRVREEQKQPIFDRLESLFSVDFSLGPNSVKKETDNLMSKRYRDYRQKMHRHYKTLTHLPWEERLKHIPTEYCRSEADWEFLCKLFESDTFKKYSVINSGNRSYLYHGGRKSLSEYKYDAVNGSGNKDGITDSNITSNSGKDCPGESAETANNDERIRLDNQDDGSQSREEANIASSRDDLQPAKSTTFDATSLTRANAELRNELRSTRIALQLTEDKVRKLEANQKSLEEKIEANTRIMEANQRMMKQVFEKIASDIAQTLPSSVPQT